MNMLTALKKKQITVPGWLFAGVMALLCEVVLHLWTVDTLVWGRFAAVAVYGLGFGGVIALLCSFFRGRAEKPATALVVLVLIVLYMTEYFMIDTYKNYMSLSTMLSRAGDVVGDFGDNVIYLITHSLGRIGLVLLPLVLYLLFARGKAAGWKLRGLLAGVALAGYLLGTGVVHLAGLDTDRYSRMYDFDSAVRSFGLNVGLTLDALRNSDVAQEPGFIQELPEQTEPATDPGETEADDVPDTTTVPTEPPVVYEPHTLGLDFALLAENETNSTIRNIHSYVASLEPAMENEYTGLFAGKNLIFITAEAFSAEVIDPERTPHAVPAGQRGHPLRGLLPARLGRQHHHRRILQSDGYRACGWRQQYAGAGGSGYVPAHRQAAAEAGLPYPGLSQPQLHLLQPDPDPQ